MARNGSGNPSATTARTNRFLVLATVLAAVAVLYFAQDVLIPITLAMLLTFLLAPAVNYLEQYKFPRPAAVLTVVLVCCTVLAVLGWVVAGQLAHLAGSLEEYRGNIEHKVEALRPSGGGTFSKLSNFGRDLQKKLEKPTTQTTQPADLVAEELKTHAGVTELPKPGTVPNPATHPTEDNPLPVAVVQPKPSNAQALMTYAGMILGPLGTFGIVIVFVIFMLLRREDLRDRVIRLIGHGSLTVTTQALDDAAERISRYLLMQSIVNGTYGVAIGIGLWLIGIPNAFLWGLLCAVLRFIPYIGPWIASAFPILLSIAVFPDNRHLVYTIGLFVVIELISNNVMEPWLYGSSTGMSEVAILVSAVFWTWLWGPVGLLMSTPLTVCLVVLGKYVPQLSFLDVMLGDEPPLEPHMRYYQRLLAMDDEEAEGLVDEYLEEMPLEDVYDTVIIPALALAEEDRHKGDLDDSRQKFIREAVREHIEHLGERRVELEETAARSATLERADAVVDTAKGQSAAGGNGKARRGKSASVDEAGEKPKKRQFKPPPITGTKEIRVLCLPARDDADEIVAHMLAQCLDIRGYSAEAVAVTALASEMVEKVATEDAHIAVVSSLPPAAINHARYLCKRLHQRFPDLPLAVGLWRTRTDLKRAKARIACDESVQVVSSLCRMIDLVDQLAQPVKVNLAAADDTPAVAAAAKKT
jgi:predicted PurR-regulated permease PerM